MEKQQERYKLKEILLGKETPIDTKIYSLFAEGITEFEDIDLLMENYPDWNKLPYKKRKLNFNPIWDKYYDNKLQYLHERKLL